MKSLPCPFCERKFEGDEGEDWGKESYRKIDRHIKSSKGHGNEICSYCGKPLSKCKDITASGTSFACNLKRR